MNWGWSIAALAFAGCAWGGASALADRRRRRSQRREAMRVWSETSPAQRVAALQRLHDRDPAARPNAAAWYLLACAHLWEGRTLAAARAFGMAHHADHRLQSAATLTFTCLKAIEGDPSEFLRQLVITWSELRRPLAAMTASDREMAACLEATTRDPPRLSELGRLAWLVGGPRHQEVIERLLEHPADWAAALQGGPASG